MGDQREAPERELEEQIIEIKRQHQIQHQILLQHFQQQQQHLVEQHEQQLKRHLKDFWERQQKLQEIRQREQLEALRKKEKHEESAIASTEVKHKLQAFLRQRASGCSKIIRNDNSWSESMDTGSDSTANNNDFPLRKTASEPNLLKVRLKQRVMERRCSPMTSKRHLTSFKKKLLSTCLPPNESPPSGSSSTTTQQEPPKELSPPCELIEDYNQRHNALFSSPSMPNISLAAHHHQQQQQHVLTAGAASTVTTNDLSEAAAVRAACTARLGMPLTGQMLPGTLPFFPSLPAIESEHEDGGINGGSASTSSAASSSATISTVPLDTINELQEPLTIQQQQQLHHLNHHQTIRGVIRPLGRTQSSPLPLGHPLLEISSQVLLQQQLQQQLQQLQQQQQQQSQPSPEEQEQRDLELRANESRSIRPLSRALSSPVVHLGGPDHHHNGIIVTSNGPQHITTNSSSTTTTSSATLSSSTTTTTTTVTRRRISSQPTTGLAYDSQMLKHACICGNNALHPEHAGRLQSIWSRLLETHLVSRCDRLRPRKATTQELQTCHTEAHSLLYGTSSLNRHKMDMSKLSQLPITAFVRLPCGGIGVDTDTTWNEIYTAQAARMAVGCTIDLAIRTWQGDIRNGFAVVRPPGHHAEPQQAMGFCFFNSVAIAAKILQREHRTNKILIFDWGVHHGNGTQEIFYDDPRVLVISIHRHDDGNFFPGSGSLDECGSGAGLGFNVNIAWSGGLNPPLGDAEYLAAFRSIVMPIALEFNPDIVLISAGFDATDGHLPPLGGYHVSPACFGYMTRQLMQLANGKLVLALEGGYDLPSICDSAEECVRVLLGDQPTQISTTELSRVPCPNALLIIQKTIAIQQRHWPCLQETIKSGICSYNDAIRNEKDDKDTVSAMASLSMQHQQQSSNMITSSSSSPPPPLLSSSSSPNNTNNYHHHHHRLGSSPDAGRPSA